MKSISLTLLAFMMIFAFGTTSAQSSKVVVLNADQVSKLDLSGKWIGKRKQYSWDKKEFVEEFQYEFELKQEGDLVTGTSTIIDANGDYADMKMEGVIVGNKFHFREFEVKGAIRPAGRVWCFKSGELYITKDGDNIKFSGSTPSFMEIYNTPCSGGYTDLVKVDAATPTTPSVSLPGTSPAVLSVNEKININVYPDPFIDHATISYNLTTDSKVNVEIFDLTGKKVTGLFDGNQKTGDYTLNFNAKDAGYANGIFIVKMTINGEIFSRQLVQMQ